MTDAEQVNASEKSSVEGISSFKALGLVFTDPVKCFKSLKEKPSIWLPYVLTVAVYGIFIWAVIDIIAQIQYDAIIEKGTQLPPGITADTMKMWILPMGIIMGAITPLFFATLAFVVGNFILGGKAKFSQVLSVNLHAGLIIALGMLITIPLILAKESMAVGFSLGILVADQGIESVAFIGLSKIGVFYIWEFIVAAIGFSAIYEFSRNKGYMVAVLSLGLVSALHVVFVALGKMFS